jgi:hypothetical protein
MNKPMIENTDRGITLNKTLAWTMMVGLIGSGLWLGGQMAELSASIEELGTRQAEDRQDIRDNTRLVNEIRRNEARVDQRLITIERSVTNAERGIQEVLEFVRRNNSSGNTP